MKVKIKVIIIWIIFIVLSIFISVNWSMSKSYFDTDLLWHMKIGEDIIKQHTIFLNNTYSWIDGTLWTQQEWLFDVILYTIVSVFGMAGFYAMHIIPQFMLIGVSIKKHSYHFDMLAPLLFLLMYIKLPFNNINRPAEFSTYFFVLMVYLYDKNFKLKPLVYFLCGIFISNFHCAAAVALLVLMGLMFASDVILNRLLIKQDTDKVNARFMLQYILSYAMFLCGLCFNPYGIKQVISMFGVMNLSSTKYINEWKSFCTNEYVVWIILFAIAYSFGYALYKYNWNRLEIIRIIAMSAFLVLSLTSAKAFIMFFYLFIAFGYKYVDDMIYDLCQKMHFKKYFKFKNIHFCWPDKLPYKNIMYVSTMCWCIMFTTFLWNAKYYSFDSFASSVRNDYATDGAIAYLKQANAKNSDDFRLLNGYVTGNYLLYYGVPCFIDSRQIPYASESGYTSAVDDYFDTNANNFDAMDDFFAKYDFNYVLSNNEYGINNYLQQRHNLWVLDYSDDYGNYIWRYIG